MSTTPGAGVVLERQITTPRCPEEIRRDTWSSKDFSLRRELGRGYASVVYHGICRRSKLDVAVKVYAKAGLNDDAVAQVRREVAIHSQLEHRHVVDLYAAFDSASAVFLVMEYAPGGDLYSRLRSLGGRMQELLALQQVLVPCVSALLYLHRQGIIHRDLKPENAVFCSGSVLKITDFGLAIDTRQEAAAMRLGTLDYMAPEVVGLPERPPPQPYTDKVDVWALGVMAYELVVGRPPFWSTARDATMLAICHKAPVFPSWVSSSARDFISLALEKQPLARLRVEDICSHAWLLRVLCSPQPRQHGAHAASPPSGTQPLKSCYAGWPPARQAPPRAAVAAPPAGRGCGNGRGGVCMRSDDVLQLQRLDEVEVDCIGAQPSPHSCSLLLCGAMAELECSNAPGSSGASLQQAPGQLARAASSNALLRSGPPLPPQDAGDAAGTSPPEEGLFAPDALPSWARGGGGGGKFVSVVDTWEGHDSGSPAEHAALALPGRAAKSARSSGSRAEPPRSDSAASPFESAAAVHAPEAGARPLTSSKSCLTMMLRGQGSGSDGLSPCSQSPASPCCAAAAPTRLLLSQSSLSPAALRHTPLRPVASAAAAARPPIARPRLGALSCELGAARNAIAATRPLTEAQSDMREHPARPAAGKGAAAAADGSWFRCGASPAAAAVSDSAFTESALQASAGRPTPPDAALLRADGGAEASAGTSQASEMLSAPEAAPGGPGGGACMYQRVVVQQPLEWRQGAAAAGGGGRGRSSGSGGPSPEAPRFAGCRNSETILDGMGSPWDYGQQGQKWHGMPHGGSVPPQGARPLDLRSAAAGGDVPPPASAVLILD